MQIKESSRSWKIFGRAFTLLLFLSLVLLSSFLGIGWLINTFQLPSFIKLPTKSEIPTSLIVNVEPSDALITLNDHPYNPKDILIPGDYIVKVSQDGFFSIEEAIRVHRNKKTQLNIQLMPMVSVEEISHFATSIGWNDQDKLYYLDSSEQKIYNWTDQISYDLVGIDGIIHELIYLPDNGQAVMETSDSSESPSKLVFVDFQTKVITDLPVTGSATLGQNNVLWGINSLNDDREKPIWKLIFGGEPQFLFLENQEWAIYVEQLLIEPTEQWLAIESQMGIAIWEISSGKLVETFEGASAPVWVKNPEPGLVFLTANNSLFFAKADFDWSQVLLLNNIQAPISGMPDGSEIVFTRYNPFEGGASFWAVDTSTLGVRLLSEAKTESGRVEYFSISPNGKKIAFVNQKNIMYLITLEP